MNTDTTNLPLHVVILAAGKGTRMHSRLAKVMLPLAGQPMLAHVLAVARTLAPANVHVVCGYQAQSLKAAFADDDISWVEQAQQLGTGDAVKQALPAIPDQARVLVLYGDMPLITTAALRALIQSTSVLGMLAAQLDDASGYGRVVLDADGCVQRIVEEKDASDDEKAITRVNTGFICARADYLRRWLQRLRNDNAQNEYYLTDVFAFAHADKQAAVCVPLPDATQAMGANSPVQLAQLERLLRRRRTHALMLEGVRMVDPERVDIRGTVSVGQDVELDVNVILEGHVTLGDGVSIGPFCRLRDVTIAAGTTVLAHSDITGADIGPRCRIGPFARLRAGSRLAEAVHIGNFVETKKASLAHGSKANHLSYLGDAQIGAGVNIGAGTITCNYDGVNKFTTTIGDHAFVGSNTALIAPVTLGANTTVGAGSVITQNVADNQLGLARAKQRNIDHWARPSPGDKS